MAILILIGVVHATSGYTPALGARLAADALWKDLKSPAPQPSQENMVLRSGTKK